VLRLFSGAFVIGAGHMAGLRFDMGLSATLRLPGNTLLVVTTHNGAHFSAELFALALGTPAAEAHATPAAPNGAPELPRTAFEASLLVAKSPGGFRATYGDRAAEMLSSDAPGCAPSRFWAPTYDSSYAHVSQPLFPWAEELEWSAAGCVSCRLPRCHGSQVPRISTWQGQSDSRALSGARLIGIR
jgi:hypothetical protein